MYYFLGQTENYGFNKKVLVPFYNCHSIYFPHFVKKKKRKNNLKWPIRTHLIKQNNTK